MNASQVSRVIDCLVNVHFGETDKQPTWMLKVRDDYFKGPESMFAPVDLSELLDEMDEHGVRKAVLMDNLAKPSVAARKFVEAKPDRFALAMGGVNLLRPMPSLRELSAVVNDLPVAYAAVGPSFWGDGQYPPNAQRSGYRCASTPAFPGRRFPVRCKTPFTSTGSVCGSPN